MAKRLLSCLAVLSLLAALGASFGASSSRRTSLKISAQVLKNAYDKKALVAPAGKITIVMANPGFTSHNIAIRAGTGRAGKTIAKGPCALHTGTSRITVVLKKGRYRYYCSFESHEADGMWGILTVK